MSLIWLNVIVSPPTEAFGHRSFPGASPLLERELLWPEEGVPSPRCSWGSGGIKADPPVEGGLGGGPSSIEAGLCVLCIRFI